MRKFSILAFGGNMPSHFGLPQVTITKSIERLPDHGVDPLKVSRFFANPAFPVGAGPDYVNAAALVETNHTAEHLLEVLHALEAEFGRTRLKRWGQRTLDIDLIAYEDLVCPNLERFTAWKELEPDAQQSESPQELILPHPRLQDRAFVLVPMAEVAPEWKHPVSGLTTVQMLNELPDSAKNEVVPL